MNAKPQINLNVNFTLEHNALDVAPNKESIIGVIKAFKDALDETAGQFKETPEPAPYKFQTLAAQDSHHHRSVAANNRISDALEYINKTLRLAEGAASTEGGRKNLEEVKRILLGI
jgi:hypothetical protein